jgi:hypothetical protein
VVASAAVVDLAVPAPALVLDVPVPVQVGVAKVRPHVLETY